MQGAAPPDPDRHAKRSPVSERDERAKAHFIRNDQLRTKLQQILHVPWRDVDEAPVNKRAIVFLNSRELPTPGSLDAGVRQPFFDVSPTFPVGLSSAMDDKQIEVIG
jgi:hypothetical protein